MSRVLVVEDEEHLAIGLRYNLENAGYSVQVVGTGEAALAAVEAAQPDLVLLDVNLPGPLSGFDVAREIRKGGNIVPILMLTARAQMASRLEGLDAGADDYLVKPFDLDEMLARVRVLLRRQVWHQRRGEGTPDPDQAPPPDEGQADKLVFGGGEVDFRTYRAVNCRGEPVQLSWREAEMMRLFASSEGEVIPRARFLEEVWGEPPTLETRSIDNYVMRLRRAFERDPKHPQHILSVRGVGYRFVR